MRSAQRRSTRLALETLEDRLVPAIYGLPWPNAQQLTLSFVPDGTQVTGQPSELFRALDARMPTAEWQQAVLRAVQTWAAKANINVAVVPDDGQPMGTGGLSHHDSRFGDIRIAARAMAADALAISVPHDPFLSGTWSGDIIVNSADPFIGSKADLYTVMLHEVGHVLGLDENSDAQSVLSSGADPSKAALSPADIAAIQSLYGARLPDSNEGRAGNLNLGSGVTIQYPTSEDKFDGSTPLVAFGDISTPGGVDVFKVKSMKGYSGPMSFRLQTAGISLLEPRLTIYDPSGKIAAQSQSTELTGGIVTVQLPRVSPEKVYSIRVDGAGTDEFGIGRYGLAVTFDPLLKVSADQINTVLRNSPSALSAQVVDEIFRHPDDVLFSDDQEETSQVSSAISLKSPAGYPANSHYEAIGSLANSTDVNFYRIVSPSTGTTPAVLTVAVDAMSIDGVASRIEVLDKLGRSVPAERLTFGDGTFTLQAANLEPNATYYLKVSNLNCSATTKGNYYLTADFRQPANLVRTFTQGTLTASAQPADDTLYVAQTQLFHFDLSAESQTAGAGVRMTISDSSGAAVFDRTANAGSTETGDVLLAPGTYSVRFTTEGTSDAPNASTHYTVHGFAISDPIGPKLVIPNATPTGTCSTTVGKFCFPGGVTSLDPFLWVNPVL